jgi:hypothetical protein
LSLVGQLGAGPPRQRCPGLGGAIWLASKDSYEDSVLPTGYPFGTAEEALDCACGPYLNDPTAGLTE